MQNKQIAALVELSLSGSKHELVDYVKDLAAKASNQGKHGLYGELKKLLNKYEKNDFPLLGLSDFSNEEDGKYILPEKIWFPKKIKHKMDSFLKMHSMTGMAVSQKSTLNKLLLYGPPGTGKTTLGFYIAKELGFSINYVRLSDVISPKFGETMKNISDIFQNSEEKIIFIDEFDAFAKKREDSNDVGELKRIVNSLIQTLDLYGSRKITIVSTNLVDSIDSAVLRRFSFKIFVDELDKEDREEFFDFLQDSLPKGVSLKFKKDEKKRLLQISSRIGLKTIDSIQQFFDKAVIIAQMREDSVLKLQHFLEGMILTDTLNKSTVKQLHSDFPDDITYISSKLQDSGYAKTDISDLLNIHRNTLGKYVE